MDTCSDMIPALRNEVADCLDEIFPTAVGEAVKAANTSQLTPYLIDFMVPGGGVEPPRSQGSADFESAASASSAIPAHLFECTSG